MLILHRKLLVFILHFVLVCVLEDNFNVNGSRIYLSFLPAALVRPYFAWILGGGLLGIVKLAPHVDNLVTQVWDPMLNSWDKNKSPWGMGTQPSQRLGVFESSFYTSSFF